jgi:hypothetical protein
MAKQNWSPWLRLGLSVVLAGTLLLQISCGLMPAAPSIDSQTMIAAVRAYGSNVEPHAARPADESESTVEASLLEPESTYEPRIRALLDQGNFEQLDKEAHDVRVSKIRVVGGTWKIYSFYVGVGTFANDHPVEADYNAKIARIKKWIAARPDSATPYIALADMYKGFAWFARGSGYASTVTNTGWRLFRERLELSKAPLLKAASLREKCPYWYTVVLDLALAEGWEKSSATEIREQANLFEPNYYHINRQYANFILPKWYGTDGETEPFVEEAADRIGGQQGDFLYFELASVAICSCKVEKPSMAGLSWPRIRRGFAVLNQLYGINDMKANRFALMAYAADDKASAREAFAKVGDNLTLGVWRTRQSFEDAKAWARTE